MSSWRRSLLMLCLVCVFVAPLCLHGCRKKEPAADNPATERAAEPAPQKPKRAEYANDLERLSQLTNRINRACRASYVVVLGGSNGPTGGGLVSVDYALFDKLSDDGAAVLIAEAIAGRPKSPSLMQTQQTQANTAKDVLQADETVGRYVARAGFSSTGFTEWLRARREFAAGLRQNTAPERMRIAAFMRGYSSARYSKGR